MLKRKIEKDIEKWLDNSEKALLVYGVRQAGKTFIIRECLKRNECEYIEFNLINQPELVEILRDSTGIDDLILKLSLYSEKKIIPGKTIFFFDEIQRYKEIVTKIKFLVEDKRFRYILSGSLLGVEIVNLKSAPVGYLQTLNMYPMDFEEFLQIFSVDEAIINNLRNCFITKTKVDEIIHNKIIPNTLCRKFSDKIDSSVLITKYSIILAIKQIVKIIKQFSIGFFFNKYIILSYSFFI